jgi:excisionase family DNA binding protein
MDKPLTVYEAAEWLKVSHWQVRRYIKSGMLKAFKLGNGVPESGSRRRWLIRLEDLKAFAYKNPNIKG